MSGRQYSAHSKLSRGAIQKAKRNGRMVLFADASINAAASGARRAGMTDPDQQRRSVASSESSINGPAESSSYLKARAETMAERPENTENANEIQHKMLEAATHRPRDHDELTRRLRDGKF